MITKKNTTKSPRAAKAAPKKKAAAKPAIIEMSRPDLVRLATKEDRSVECVKGCPNRGYKSRDAAKKLARKVISPETGPLYIVGEDGTFVVLQLTAKRAAPDAATRATAAAPAPKATGKATGPKKATRAKDGYLLSAESPLFCWGFWSRRSSSRPASPRRRLRRRPGAGGAWW